MIELLNRALRPLRLEVSRLRRGPIGIPDAELYLPWFSPWKAATGEFAEIYRRSRPYTNVSVASCWVLYNLAMQAQRTLEGEWWECGVYQGGTAMMLANLLGRDHSSRRRVLRLFDTFTGLPETDSKRDRLKKGTFAATLISVQRKFEGLEFCTFHPGLIPATFGGLEDQRIALAHVDVDLYRSVKDCCEFLYPRLVAGGFIVFDDYGFPSCPGARLAVDEFFSDIVEQPLCLPTGQAILYKSAAPAIHSGPKTTRQRH